MPGGLIMHVLLPMAGVMASMAVALLLLVAGLDKLRHRTLLPGVIANYRLLPSALVAPAAALLAPAELLLAAGLVAGVTPWAPLAAIALLLLFAGAMAINIMRGRRHIDCGCGHAGLRQALGWGQVARNVMLALALLPALIGREILAMADIAVAMAAGVAGWLLLLMLQALAGLAATAPDRVRG